MDIPELTPVRKQAMDIIVKTFNKAKDVIGFQLKLHELAASPTIWGTPKLSMKGVKIPIGINGEYLLADAIELKWKLTEQFRYHIKYLCVNRDEVCEYYYFEVIFSQPTVEFPIPQVAVSVFFKIKVMLTTVKPSAPTMSFRLEGHQAEHDVATTLLTAESILGVMKMKIRFFKSIETFALF